MRPATVLPPARIGTVVSSPCPPPLAANTLASIKGVKRLQNGRAGAALVGRRRYAETDAFARIAFAVVV